MVTVYLVLLYIKIALFVTNHSIDVPLVQQAIIYKTICVIVALRRYQIVLLALYQEVT
jgi:hypothetical protein